MHQKPSLYVYNVITIWEAGAQVTRALNMMFNSVYKPLTLKIECEGDIIDCISFHVVCCEEGSLCCRLKNDCIWYPKALRTLNAGETSRFDFAKFSRFGTQYVAHFLARALTYCSRLATFTELSRSIGRFCLKSIARLYFEKRVWTTQYRSYGVH